MLGIVRPVARIHAVEHDFLVNFPEFVRLVDLRVKSFCILAMCNTTRRKIVWVRFDVMCRSRPVYEFSMVMFSSDRCFEFFSIQIFLRFLPPYSVEPWITFLVGSKHRVLFSDWLYLETNDFFVLDCPPVLRLRVAFDFGLTTSFKFVTSSFPRSTRLFDWFVRLVGLSACETTNCFFEEFLWNIFFSYFRRIDATGDSLESFKLWFFVDSMSASISVRVLLIHAVFCLFWYGPVKTFFSDFSHFWFSNFFCIDSETALFSPPNFESFQPLKSFVATECFSLFKFLRSMRSSHTNFEVPKGSIVCGLHICNQLHSFFLVFDRYENFSF